MCFPRTRVRASVSVLVVFLILTISGPAMSQQAGPASNQTSPQALALLQKSLAVLTGGQPITDVTLTGTARRIAGSDDESGAATLRAIPGASRLDLSLSAGVRTEVSNLTTSPAAGSWSGPDGVPHAMAFHNLLTEPAWFFPAFAILRRLANSSGFVASYLGEETRNAQAVQHVSVSQTPPFADPPGAPTFAHLTQVDFFLDPATLLPAAITFNIHPDNDASLDIPVEISLSDYRSVNGSKIPFQIQKFLNNSLLLDFQAQSVTFNSGLSDTLFNFQ